MIVKSGNLLGCCTEIYYFKPRVTGCTLGFAEKCLQICDKMYESFTVVFYGKVFYYRNFLRRFCNVKM